MTVRDPGQPRRNPFFEHDSDGEPDDPGMGFRESVDDATTTGFAALMALAEGLAEAQPEAAEHLVAAAHEVVLTVKVLVDTTEAVLADQRAAMAERREQRDEAARMDATAGPSAGSSDGVTDLLAFRPAEEP